MVFALPLVACVFSFILRLCEAKNTLKPYGLQQLISDSAVALCLSMPSSAHQSCKLADSVSSAQSQSPMDWPIRFIRFDSSIPPACGNESLPLSVEAKQVWDHHGTAYQRTPNPLEFYFWLLMHNVKRLLGRRRSRIHALSCPAHCRAKGLACRRV